jgi:hypothetical protein
MAQLSENQSGTRSPGRALASGIAGAAVLTGLHEVARRVVPHAPRMDVIGERALSDGMKAAGMRPPRGSQLFRATLLGELVSNALYYSVVGAGSRARALRRGVLVGLAAGLGAVFLPPRMGLGRPPGNKPPVTPLLTIAWYTAGGLAAALAAQLVHDQTAG